MKTLFTARTYDEETHGSYSSADIVEWHGYSVSEDPRLQLVRVHRHPET